MTTNFISSCLSSSFFSLTVAAVFSAVGNRVTTTPPIRLRPSAFDHHGQKEFVALFPAIFLLNRLARPLRNANLLGDFSIERVRIRIGFKRLHPFDIDAVACFKELNSLRIISWIINWTVGFRSVWKKQNQSHQEHSCSHTDFSSRKSHTQHQPSDWQTRSPKKTYASRYSTASLAHPSTHKPIRWKLHGRARYRTNLQGSC